jgi:protein-tyrosine phosphatase
MPHRFTTSILALLMIAPPAPLGARQQPPSAVDAKATPLRRLPLEGAANFRDLGGYPTSDGRHVKWGLVYRSSHLASLTAADYAYLGRLGIKLVCDLRTDGERRRFPTVWQGSAKPEIMPASILKETDVVLTRERLKQLATPGPSSDLSSTYDRMVVESPAQYGRVIRRLAHGDLPAVTHCTAGKDRTGVFSAILLTMLGVPRQFVVDDYMLTGDYMLSEEGLRRAASDWKTLTGAATPPEPQVLKAIYTMHPEAITGTLDTIDRTYGSFDAFVRTGLTLSDADVAALRSRLLE